MRFIAGYTQLESLVEEALGETPDAPSLDRLLVAVQENLQRADTAVHAALRGTVLTAALFELLSRASVTEANIWGLQLADLANIQKVLPLVIAFFFYYAMAALAVRRIYVDVHAQALRFLHRDTDLAALKYLMHPFSLVSAESLLLSLYHGRVGTTAGSLSFITGLGLIVGPPAIIAYAVVSNLQQFGISDWLGSIASFVAVLLTARGLLSLFVLGAAMRESKVSE